MKTKQIDYSTYEVESDEVSQELMDLIENGLKYEPTGALKVRNVESPFILADNYFDLNEANNNIIEIGVERVKTVTFNGGAFYTEYVKVAEPAVVVQGNSEEGYNIFILK